MSVIQPTRRGALATSAAAAAASLLPEHLAAAPDAINGVTSMTGAIRPFRVTCPPIAHEFCIVARPRSTGWTFISFTFVRNMKMHCRSSSRTDGLARLSSS